MDNTDGIGQSLLEQAEYNNLEYCLYYDSLKIHDISYKVSNFLNIDVIDLVLGAGADFSLVGTISKEVFNRNEKGLLDKGMYLIGECLEGKQNISVLFDREKKTYEVSGWNYFQKSE